MRGRGFLALVGLVVALGCVWLAAPASANVFVGADTLDNPDPGDPAGVITVTGQGTANDNITVAYDSVHDTYVVTDTDGAGPFPSDTSCTQTNTTTMTCPRPLVQQVEVNIFGEDGNDQIRAGWGALAWHSPDFAKIVGGIGNDQLGGSPGDDEIAGTDGDDLIDGAAGNDTVTGGAEPVVTFLDGDDAGADTLYGGPGADELTDGDQDGTQANVGSDVVDGGVCPSTKSIGGTACTGGTDPSPAGDTLDIARPAPYSADLEDTTADQGQSGENEQILNIENARIGSFGGATIEGTEGPNLLIGSGDDDEIQGRGGDDQLVAGEGHDTVSGGEGNDTIDPGNDNETSDGPDTLNGGPGEDTADYHLRAHPISVNLGSSGGQGAPGENDVFSSIEDVIGGSNADTIRGGPGPNKIFAGVGADHITSSGDGAVDQVHCGADSDSATVDVFDSVAAGGTDACESLIRVGGSSAGGGGGGVGSAITSAAIAGKKSAGTVRIGKNRFGTLPTKVSCSGSGPDCSARSGGSETVKVAAVVVARKHNKKIKLSGYSFKVKAGASRKVKIKLSKKALKALVKAKKAKASVSISVKRTGAATAKRTVKVTLKPPTKKKHKKH